jgi:hypothetical protein
MVATQNELSVVVEAAIKDINAFLVDTGYAGQGDPTRGSNGQAYRPSTRDERAKLLALLEERKNKLESAGQTNADRRLWLLLILFFVVVLLVTGIIVYMISVKRSEAQLTLISSAVGEGGIFYLIVREFKNFVTESANIQDRALVVQAFDFGRDALASLNDGADVVMVMAMVKEMVREIKSSDPRAGSRANYPKKNRPTNK